MRCPSCGTELDDRRSRHCPRCGATPPAEGDSTEELSEASAGPEPTTKRLSPEAEPARPGQPGAAVRRLTTTGRWADVVAAAGVGFLGTLIVGVVLLLAAKLQQPDLGAGANPVDVLSAIVIITLATLGVPVQVDGIEVAAFPLGALVAAGAAIAWAARPAASRAAAGARARAGAGAQVGVPFAAMCLLAALVFRIRSRGTDVAAGAPEALFFGALWGTLFGALGGLSARSSLRSLAGDAAGLVKRRSLSAHRGLISGAVMTGAAAVLSTTALLLWVIAGLIRGALPASFGFGDAIAAIVYLVAFLPNILIAILALSLGASIEVGGGITIGGRLVGETDGFSLFDWGGAGVPWPVLLLPLIPALACGLGGFVARVNAPEGVRVRGTLGTAAAAFAVVLFTASLLGAARIGSGRLFGRGFAVIAPREFAVLLLAFAWASVAGYAGWRLAEARSGRFGKDRV